MKQLFIVNSLIFLCFAVVSCIGQNKQSTQKLSADFDHSPPIYYGMPDVVNSTDISPAWNLAGQKIHLTGIVYQSDGKTPAPDLLIYYYQTNLDGRYVHKEDQARSMPPNASGQTHGYIRGWVKTDVNGKYSIKTVRPGSYPNGNEVAHVHAYVADPAFDSPYYIDDFVFEDDPLLTKEKRRRFTNRGGSGILSLVQKNDVFVGWRNIILGLNI